MILSVVAAIVIAYLLGNLNGAIIASRLYAHEDVREKGSGNAGLTNFIRSFGMGKALLVIFLDVGKAVLACLFGRLLLAPYGEGTTGAVIAAVAVILLAALLLNSMQEPPEPDIGRNYTVITNNG